MAEPICKLHIVNKRAETRVLGKSILGPYYDGLYNFFSVEDVMYAQKLEKDKRIEIKTDIPSNILDEISKKEEQSDKYKSPVDQVRDNFDGHTVHDKNQPGWNSPDDAYKGDDLKDREGGFASTSSVATNEDSESEKVSPDGEEPSVTPDEEQMPESAWNSPDDAYEGEDLKDRGDKESIEEIEENIGEVARKTEERMAEGPQDQNNDEPVDQKPINENMSDEKDETPAPEGEKPSWYMDYDQVEDKTKQELLDWAENEVPEEEGLKLKSSDSAAATKENVHNFLSEKYPDHTA